MPAITPPFASRSALALIVLLLGFQLFPGYRADASVLSLEGVHVVPHVQSTEMQYRKKPDFSLGARVEV